jgi:hypothetical protein
MVKFRGMPHLAKNERDMGHPASLFSKMVRVPAGTAETNIQPLWAPAFSRPYGT